MVNLLYGHVNTRPKIYYSREHRLIMHTFWHVKTTYVDQMIEYIIDSMQRMNDVHSIWFVRSMDLNKILKKLGLFLLFLCEFKFLSMQEYALD